MMNRLTLTSIICYILLNMSTIETSQSKIHSADPHPCSTVSCYFNAMCVVDPDTKEPFCKCQTSDCDSQPDYPVCADGVTFQSPCHAAMYSCEQQRKIDLHHIGVCNETDCGPTNPCGFYGYCDGGVCTCKSCDHGDDFDIEGVQKSNPKVCGSDGKIYGSECEMQYESCRSKSKILATNMSTCREKLSRPKSLRAVVEHMSKWIGSIEPLKEEISVPGDLITSRSAGSTSSRDCQKFELNGCLSPQHPRYKHLGVYSIEPSLREYNAPVYKRITTIGAVSRPVYISRFKLPTFPNGSWIIGTQVNSGRGWFGVKDPSLDPRNISHLWLSNVRNVNGSYWRPEPSIKLHCVGEAKSKIYDIKSCVLNEVHGKRLRNAINKTLGNPVFQLNIRDKEGNNVFEYMPQQYVEVQIHSNIGKIRFKTVYLAMTNDVDECGMPILTRGRRRFKSTCEGQLITRNGERMGKVKMELKMPLRGCVTFRALLKSIKNGVYYDKDELEHSKYLTKTLCVAESE